MVAICRKNNAVNTWIQVGGSCRHAQPRPALLLERVPLSGIPSVAFAFAASGINPPGPIFSRGPPCRPLSRMVVSTLLHSFAETPLRQQVATRRLGLRGATAQGKDFSGNDVSSWVGPGNPLVEKKVSSSTIISPS